MDEFTPGPWRDDDGTIVAGDGPINIAYTRTVIAEREAEQRANARLIAAAPDLLAACEAYVAADQMKDPGAYLRALDALSIQMRTAIAKARGGE